MKLKLARLRPRLLTIIISVFMLSALFGACSSSSAPTTRHEVLTPEIVLAAFKAANLPIRDEIVYTAESDPNKLLGRLNQYKGKANWNDKRMVGFQDPSTAEVLEKNPKMTIEIFTSPIDIKNRLEAAEGDEYQFVYKDVVLRLTRDLTAEQAAEYDKVLRRL